MRGVSLFGDPFNAQSTVKIIVRDTSFQIPSEKVVFLSPPFSLKLYWKRAGSAVEGIRKAEIRKSEIRAVREACKATF